LKAVIITSICVIFSLFGGGTLIHATSDWDDMYYDNAWNDTTPDAEAKDTPVVEVWLGEKVARFGRTQFKVQGGMPTYPTPKGYFKIYWKSREHKSSQWDDAPMPYAMFFKDGAAIHQGPLYGESHGCVRVSNEMAKYLFDKCFEKRTHVVVYP